MISLNHILFFSSALFAVGAMGLFVKRSLLRILLAIEAMLNGAAFGFIGTAIHFQQIDGQVMFLIVLAIAAAEVSVALAILLHYDRLFHRLDITLIHEAKD
jgi:NADH-quinone oxidoreductase subunit K